MLDTSRYLYVAYMCQQAVEKLLKAIMAYQGKENIPVHNLIRLSELAEIKDNLNSEQFNFLAELTPYCIEARYGNYKKNLTEIINEEKAKEFCQKTQDIFRWLYQQIK